MNNLDAKKAFWWLLNLCLAVALVLGLKVLVFRTPLINPEMTVVIGAEGKATVTPDIATLHFSVISEGKDPVALQRENTVKMNTAIDFIKGLGIDKKDIKTAGYNLYPKYEYTRSADAMYPYPGKQIISGYTLTQTVEVKVRDLEKVASVLAGLPEKGINQIDGPNFSVEDPDKYLNEARREAFVKARAKAEAMTRANGMRITRVVTFSENQGGYPIMYARAEAIGKGGSFDLPVAPPSIEPGSQEVNVEVSVTYAIR